MISNEEITYLTINHKNKIQEIDKEGQRIQTLELFTTLSSIDEDIVGNNINKFFNQILPENSTSNDILSICKEIASKEKIEKDTISASFNVILNKSTPIALAFDKNSINDLFNCLVGIFKIIKDAYPSIQSYEDLLSLCKTFNLSNNKKVIMKQFVIANGFENSEKNVNNNNDNALKSVSTISVANSTAFSSDRKYSSQSRNSGQFNGQSSPDRHLYQYRETKNIQYTLPIEAMILMVKFEAVRQLKLSLRDIEERLIRPFIMILFNLRWMFSNVIEIEVDLSHETIYHDLEQYYNVKLDAIAKSSKKMLKNTNYDTGYKTTRQWKPSYEVKGLHGLTNCDYIEDDTQFNDYDNNSNAFEGGDEQGEIIEEYMNIKTAKPEPKKIVAYKDIIIKHRAVFEMTIVYSYFLSQMNSIYIMSIILPDCFKREVMKTLKEREIFLFNYHFFSFLNNFTQLIQLTCDINSLDSATFEKLIGLIYQNHSLKTLQLSLFPPEEYFSPEMLLKLIASNGFNYNSIFPKKISKLNTDVGLNEEMDNMIMNKLIDSFEINMQTLFLLIEQKDTLTEIVLLLDLPSLIFNNELYTMILFKFFFNLFIYLQSPQCNFTTFSILAPFFRFDNRKYPILSSFCDKINLHQSRVSKVKRYTLQGTFFNLCNLYRIIPSSVRILALSDLDLDTFTHLIDHLTSSEHKNSFTYLHAIKISLSKTITSYRTPISSSIKKLLTRYPKNLKEVYLFSWIRIRDSEFDSLMKEISYNSLEKCQFEFNRNNVVDDLNKDRECFYLTHTTKAMWRIIRVLKSLSRGRKGMIDKRLFDVIDRYLSRKVKKEIKVTYKNTL